MISAEANIQMFPDVAYGGGMYLAVWSDSRISTSQYNIYAARINTSGTVLDPSGIAVGPLTATVQYCPSVASNGSAFYAVWGNYSTPGGLYGRFVYTNGTVSDTFKLATGDYIYGTAIACSGANFMVIWAEYVASAFALKGLIVSSSGNPVGSQFTIAPNVEYYNGVNLCWDGTNYFVAYADATPSGTHQIWGQKYNTTGSPVGGAIAVSNAVNLCYYPNVAAGNNNRYLNVWDEQYGMYNKAHGNVDIQFVGIEEVKNRMKNGTLLPTIISGQITLPAEGCGKVYDAAGREVKIDNPAPGIYFIEQEGTITRKVIKIR